MSDVMFCHKYDSCIIDIKLTIPVRIEVEQMYRKIQMSNTLKPVNHLTQLN